MNLPSLFTSGASLATGGTSKLWIWLGLALAVVLALVGAFVGGYRHGAAFERAKGEAALSAYEAHVERGNSANALAALKLYEKQDEHGRQVAADLSQALKDIRTAKARITKERIAHAAQLSALSAGGDVVLAPEFVRLVNEACGYPQPAGPLPQAAAGAPGDPGAAAAPGPGVLREGVTLRDLGLFLKHFGGYAQDLRRRLSANIAWAVGLPEAAPGKE